MVSDGAALRTSVCSPSAAGSKHSPLLPRPVGRVWGGGPLRSRCPHPALPHGGGFCLLGCGELAWMPIVAEELVASDQYLLPQPLGAGHHGPPLRAADAPLRDPAEGPAPRQGRVRRPAAGLPVPDHRAAG